MNTEILRLTRKVWMERVKAVVYSDRSARKHFIYECARLYDAEVDGMTRKEMREHWKAILGRGYDNLMRNLRAIRAWQNSGVEYPYEIPVRLLILSQGLDNNDKAAFVDYWNDGHKSEEVDDWIRSRPSFKGVAHLTRDSDIGFIKNHIPPESLSVYILAIKSAGHERVAEVLSGMLAGRQETEGGCFDDE